MDPSLVRKESGLGKGYHLVLSHISVWRPNRYRYWFTIDSDRH